MIWPEIISPRLHKVPLITSPILLRLVSEYQKPLLASADLLKALSVCESSFSSALYFSGSRLLTVFLSSVRKRLACFSSCAVLMVVLSRRLSSCFSFSPFSRNSWLFFFIDSLRFLYSAVPAFPCFSRSRISLRRVLLLSLSSWFASVILCISFCTPSAFSCRVHEI